MPAEYVAVDARMPATVWTDEIEGETGRIHCMATDAREVGIFTGFEGDSDVAVVYLTPMQAARLAARLTAAADEALGMPREVEHV